MVILIIIWRCVFLYNETQKIQIRVVLDSSSLELAQLYYDRGAGFSEFDSTVSSSKQSLSHKISRLVQNRFDFKAYNNAIFSFEIPKDEISALRFIPLGNENNLQVIDEVNLIDGLGNILVTIQSSSSQGQIEMSGQIPSVVGGESIGSQSPVYDIPLPRSLSLHTFSKGSIGLVFILRVLFEISIVAVLVFLVFISKTLSFHAPVDLYISKKISSFRGKHSAEGYILLAFSALYLYFYPVLNDSLFPLLFEKVVFCLLLLIIFRDFIFLSYDSKMKSAPFIFCVLLFVICLLLSTYVHYSALQNDDLIKYVSMKDERFSGTLVDIYRAANLMIDRKVTSDQAVFALFFPLLILVSLSLFRASANGWRVLLFLPLVFLPDCLIALYQSGGSRLFEINDAVGFSGEIVSFRSLLFLMFPLMVLGVVLSRKIAMKVVYLLAILLLFLLLRLTYGRGAILGIFAFVFVFPMIWMWVKGLWRVKLLCSYLGAILIAGMVISGGILFPKYQSIMSVVFTERLVATLYGVLDRNPENTFLEEEPRPEMQRQAVRLFREAPVAGWGPAAFQINSNRMRYLHGDKPGIAHVMTSLYLQMATNFGVIGFVVFGCLHWIPIWMVWRVRQNITDLNTRWAVGVIVSTVLIMSLLFTVNPNISVPVTNWVYSLFLGYLMSVALKNGYEPARRTNKIVLPVGGLVVALFAYGSYVTSYGESGYQSVQEKLLHRIVDNYSESGQKIIWDNKQLNEGYQVTNRLIHTRANPFRHKYTTQVISLQAASAPVSIDMDSDLLCIETDIAEQSNSGNIYMTLKLFLGDDLNGEMHVFRSGGKHLLYYKIPPASGGFVKARVEVDMWKAIPYHADHRDTIDQIYIPHHKDYQDLGTTIKILSYKNRL